MIERMETTYYGLLPNFPTYLLLNSFKITTFLLLLSSNIGKVAELWTLRYTAKWINYEYLPEINPGLRASVT